METRDSNSIVYPMKLKPAYKDYLWGGNNLKNIYKKTSDLEIVAESWELSCHPNGCSFINNGIFNGKALIDVIKKYPSFVTSDFKVHDKFPILIKFIDANKDLSIQVHPSDANADIIQGEQGKAEMWYVIQCEPQSYIYYGLCNEIKKDQLISVAHDGTVCEYLNKIPVNEGDIFFIHPGTIHALGKGILIAEIQQNSDTTFRVFDYFRKDANGKLRPLHVERAANVINYKPIVPNKFGENNTYHTSNYEYSRIFTCEYFKVALIRCRKKITLYCEKQSFHSLLVAKGAASLTYNENTYKLEPGDSCFIPAGAGDYEIESKNEVEILLSTI